MEKRAFNYSLVVMATYLPYRLDFKNPDVKKMYSFLLGIPEIELTPGQMAKSMFLCAKEIKSQHGEFDTIPNDKLFGLGGFEIKKDGPSIFLSPISDMPKGYLESLGLNLIKTS